MLLCAVTLLSAAATAKCSAQDIHIVPPPDPCYVGEPASVQIEVRRCKPGEPATCRLQGAPPAGVTVQDPLVDHSLQRRDMNINGDITSTEYAGYFFSFKVTADREGTYKIGPFEVTYQGTVKQVDGVMLQFSKLENDPDMQIAFSLPRDVVYVGQDVPVTIRWSFTGEEAFFKFAQRRLQIRSPLFDQFAFKALPTSQDEALTIVIGQRRGAVPANLVQEERDGRPCFVLSGTLVFAPDTPEKHESVPITCRTEKVTQVEEIRSGQRVATETALACAAGTPLSFEVKLIPVEGRPASFSSAVGTGFSFDVSANRSVVHVGDPISLTLSVRGNGNLRSVSMPALAKNTGMSADLFQIPSEEVAGTLDGNTKQFKVNLRVKDQQVTQIPPIEFSWFDPSQEQFQTTQSKPIALQVMEAQVVSAADVVSAVPTAASTTASDDKSPGTSGSGDKMAAGLTFVGANLAIEQDANRLLTNTALGASPRTIAIVVYALAVAVLVGGVVLRRRAQMDTETLRKKKRLKSLRKQITSAEHLPARESADLIAKTLRELVAQYDVRRRSEADSVIALCENIIYATDQSDGNHMRELTQQARALIDDAAEGS